MTTPTINIDELERLARAATQEPWLVEDKTYVMRNLTVEESDDRAFGHVAASCDDERDAAYIAAANPAAILALIKLARENVTQAIVDSVYHPDAEMCERETAICLSQEQARRALDWHEMYDHINGSDKADDDLAFHLKLAADGDEPEASHA